MRRMIIDQDIRPMSEFRSGVASFVKQVHGTKRPLVITQHGKGVSQENARQEVLMRLQQ